MVHYGMVTSGVRFMTLGLLARRIWERFNERHHHNQTLHY